MKDGKARAPKLEHKTQNGKARAPKPEHKTQCSAHMSPRESTGRKALAKAAER